MSYLTYDPATSKYPIRGFSNPNSVVSPDNSADPYFDNVVLYLKGDGTNGSTAIVDESPTPKTISVFGDAQISTTQSKYGGSSIYFDGSGDYLTTPSGIDFDWFVEDYTVEAWVYSSSWSNWSDPSRSRLCGLFSATSDVSYWSFGVNTTGKPLFYYFNLSPTTITSNITLGLNAWHHIAITHEKGVGLYFGINGVVSSSVAVNGTPQLDYSVAPNFTLGQDNSNAMTGYFDSLRITKGVARYTANFDPETDTYLAY